MKYLEKFNKLFNSLIAENTSKDVCPKCGCSAGDPNCSECIDECECCGCERAHCKCSKDCTECSCHDESDDSRWRLTGRGK